MALDFNKINRVAAFNPTTAFPLDARSYFESYDSALAAAALAKEAGDTTTVYYWGQTFAVVENNEAQLYIVQPDGSLKGAGGKITVDENAFTLDENGVLWLEGFAEAVAGAQLVKGADGKLSWVKPDTTTVEGLNTTVEALKKDVEILTNAVGTPATETAEATGLYADLDSKANASDVYTKTETDTAISTAVVNASRLKRMIVENEAAILDYANKNADAEQIIFMVPTGLQYDANKYYEYIVLKNVDSETDAVTYTVEKVGSWDIDLADYAKKSDLYVTSTDDNFSVTDGKLSLNTLSTDQIEGLEESLQNKVTIIEGYGLVSLTEIEKLSTIDENAEENFIKEVDNTNFTVDENGKLFLNDIDITKVSGLDDLLNNSSTGLASRVIALEETVSNNTTNIENIMATLNGTDESEGLSTIIEGLNSQVTTLKTTVETNTTKIEGLETQVSTHTEKITGLETQVSTNSETIAILNDEVADIKLVIEGLDDTYVTKTTYLKEVGSYTELTHVVAEDSTLIDEVNNLIDAMTWKDLSEVNE